MTETTSPSASAPGATGTEHRKVRIWDVPVRLFHWILVLCVLGAYLTAELETLPLGFADIEIRSFSMWEHKWIGYTILTLVLFRLAWGFIGSRHARFADFLRGPGAALRYVKAMKNGGQPESDIPLGHNPVGGWMVLALLLLLLGQVTTGLFLEHEENFTSGPLAQLVSSDVRALMLEAHEVIFNLILLLVALHVAAALFYKFVKKENLIHAMVTGFKHLTPGMAERAEREQHWVSPLLALAIVVIAAGVVWGLVSLA